MTKLETIATVIDLACLTQDRMPAEQRAMLDLALRVDLDRGAFLTGNGDLAPPTLVSHVEATYNPSDGGRLVSLTAAQRGQYDRLCARWARCGACGWPFGVHPLDGCPDDVFVPFRDQLVEWRQAVRAVRS